MEFYYLSDETVRPSIQGRGPTISVRPVSIGRRGVRLVGIPRARGKFHRARGRQRISHAARARRWFPSRSHTVHRAISLSCRPVPTVCCPFSSAVIPWGHWMRIRPESAPRLARLLFWPLIAASSSVHSERRPRPCPSRGLLRGLDSARQGKTAQERGTGGAEPVL